MKILYAIAEAYPFIMTGGLGDVAGSLPLSIRNKSAECRVVLPLYSDIPEEFRSKMKYITDFTVALSWRKQYCGIFKMKLNKTVYYFVDNEYYFKRPGIYGHYDDGERFAFFSLAVLEMLRYINYKPDILHANDWHTALIPVYRKLLYGEIEDYKKCKTIFTIHNILYQGQFGCEVISDLFGLRDLDMPYLEYRGCINLMKAAIATADAVTTVSPTYAKELTDPYYAHGFEDIIRLFSYKISGIINGIDTHVYNPETDEFIFAHYSKRDLSGKALNKKNLQKILKLPEKESIPFLSMITRLVDHKGLELVKASIETLLSGDIQIVILGKGDSQYEDFFEYISQKYPQKMAFQSGFFPDIAHKIYAGSDLFLMPSKSEPCGLSQMVALRYGTIPIVRETGGLKDSVIDCENKTGNGFTFKNYDTEDMLNAYYRAEKMYKDRIEWESLINRAMLCDFSWDKSAGEYIKLYQSQLY